MENFNNGIVIPGEYDYRLVALVRNQEVVFYKEFGGYQGEWLLCSLDKDNNFYFYKDWYGSCGACDWLQRKDYKYDYKEEETILSKKQAEEIIEAYKPFVEIKKETLQYYLQDEETFIENFTEWFLSFSPANSRLEIEDSDIENMAKIIYKKLK